MGFHLEGVSKKEGVAISVGKKVFSGGHKKTPMVREPPGPKGEFACLVRINMILNLMTQSSEGTGEHPCEPVPPNLTGSGLHPRPTMRPRRNRQLPRIPSA